MRAFLKVVGSALAAFCVLAACTAGKTPAVDATPSPSQFPLTKAEFASAIAEGAINADILDHLDEFNAVRGLERDQVLAGARGFLLDTFKGNGRTCGTCHSITTGTFTPAEARERFAKNPTGPLFRAIDSDNGDGKSYNQLLRNGTVTVTIPLPPGVKLADDPKATKVTLRRGTPSFLNVAALDPILMHDGRAPNLQAQALDAHQVHSQISRQPTRQDLAAITLMEKSRFTAADIQSFANGGSEPRLPQGSTASERRGREFFISQPVDVKTGHGICAACHSGPLLDTTNEHLVKFFPQVIPLPGTDIKFGAEAGFRVFTNTTAEQNTGKLPVRNWLLLGPDGKWQEVKSPDIGLALAPVVVGVPERFKPYLKSPALLANIFKINSLRGISRTPPYFHDNSAITLHEAVEHYDRFFRGGIGFPGSQAKIELSQQDIADIVAYLEVL